MQTILKQIKRCENYDFNEGETFNIILEPSNSSGNESNSQSNPLSAQFIQGQYKMQINRKYTVTVKRYMTYKSNPRFDFMAKWNDDKPMPMRIMHGEVIKETRGMVYMELEGKAEPTTICRCCGKTLTNPISKLYGIGPECSSKLGIIRIESEDEAREKWNELVEQIGNIKWQGWIIKSAITEWEDINDE